MTSHLTTCCLNCTTSRASESLVSTIQLQSSWRPCRERNFRRQAASSLAWSTWRREGIDSRVLELPGGHTAAGWAALLNDLFMPFNVSSPLSPTHHLLSHPQTVPAGASPVGWVSRLAAWSWRLLSPAHCPSDAN